MTTVFSLIFNLAAFLPFSHFFSDFSAGSLLSLIDSSMKTVQDNKINMYRDAAAVKEISELMLQYLSI